MSTTTNLIAQRLARAGCRHAFGIPGGEVLAMMQSLESSGIRFRLCRHENAGGFMAEGTFHATGAPGILLATIGPGLVNGINTVVNAWQDQVPLIVLSGCMDSATAQSYTHQVFEQTEVMRPITKGSFTMADGAVDLMIDKAVSIAIADPQGPVHVDIPVALADRGQPTGRRASTAPVTMVAPAAGPDLDQARAKLARAERPVMIGGVGAVAHDAGAVITEICERFSMPFIATYKAKGLLPDDHPLSLGGHGLSPKSDAIILPLIKQADCILLAGYDPIEMRAGWIDPWDPAIAIDLPHAVIRHGMHGAALSFPGNVTAGLAAVTDDIHPRDKSWLNGEPARVREALASAFAVPTTWGPHQAFAAARRASPSDTVVTVDSGAHRILLSQMWTCLSPRTLLQSTALCTMGVALPLAIGYKLSRPDTPVLAIMGDAGLEMVAGELATLRDLRLPMAIMVMVDRSLALIELKQRASGRPNLGVNFGRTDFAALAEAMGGIGREITDPETLDQELAAAYARDRFTLLACDIGAAAYDGAF
ncbi:MAG: thiamine pyrophosphate-binding protein [Rhodospirillaceae bacterium]|nr:thiamine pyrophosphate-binding protein [Rhodospirillaceae bacterium]